MVEEHQISIVASRYAQALIRLGEENHKLDEYLHSLVRVQNTLAENKELAKFLEHPIISKEDKKEVVCNVFQSHISIDILNTLKVLLDRNRTYIFNSLISHYKELLNQKRNITMAEVITAVPINEDIKYKLKDKLQSQFNKNFQIEHRIDPEIIAGVIVKFGDRVIDGSIKSKLKNMKKHLA